MSVDGRPAVRMGTPAARWVLLATVLGASLVMLDATVVNVALPRIGRELDADFAGLQWIVNGYALTLAALILLGGALGDRYGRRRVFLAGVVWFAVASALCGLAPSVELLALGRALQGVGGALLTPGSLAILAATFDGVDRARAVGAWSGLTGVAGAVGPFAGGWLVEWSWRVVFLVNLPVAAAVLIITARHVPESRDPAASPRLDLTGSVLGAAGLGGLTYGLIAAGERGVNVVVTAWLVAGVAMLVAFVVVQRRSDHPLVPLELFGSRRFTVVNLVTFAAYAALAVFFFLLVLNIQLVAGFSALAAGAALLPVTVLMLVLSARVGALAGRIGARPLLTVGLLVAAAGALLARRIGPDASYLVDILPCVVVFGFGLSLVVAPLTATVLDSVAGEHVGVASGVNNAVARAAGLLAVAVVPVAAGLSGADYADPAVFTGGFRSAMVVCGALLATGAGVAWLLRPEPVVAVEPVPAGAVPPGVAVPAGAVPGRDPAVRRLDVARLPHCGVNGPALHPRAPG